MYALIVASSTAATVAQKYPRAHMCCPQYRFLSSGNSACRWRLDRPFTYCTSFEGDKIGGADNNRCMWSGETAPRTMTTSRAAQIWRVRSRARSAIRPRSILYRYFVHQITWYFRSKTACALCLYSVIPSLSKAWNELLKADRLKGGGIRPGGRS